MVQRLERNEDNRLVEFIKRIHKSDNKALIMTTREYILKQAEAIYSLLERANLSRAKYIIDLSHYTRPVKAPNII